MDQALDALPPVAALNTAKEPETKIKQINKKQSMIHENVNVV